MSGEQTLRAARSWAEQGGCHEGTGRGSTSTGRGLRRRLGLHPRPEDAGAPRGRKAGLGAWTGRDGGRREGSHPWAQGPRGPRPTPGSWEHGSRGYSGPTPHSAVTPRGVRDSQSPQARLSPCGGEVGSTPSTVPRGAAALGSRCPVGPVHPPEGPHGEAGRA